MKFNIEVELDWIDEEEGLDGAVQKRIVDAVINQAQGLVESKVNETINKNLDSVVQATCEKLVDEFTSGKFIRTDKWGDVVEQDTLKNHIKKSFDKYWSAQVDSRGDAPGYHSKGVRSRVKWLIDKRIAEHAKEFAKTLVDDTDAKIKNNMRESLSKSIGAKLVTEFGFDKLLVTDGKNK